MTEPRTKYLDYDARPEPKTSRWCARCQRDIKAGQPARIIRLRVEDMHVLHPDDAGDEGEDQMIGLDCAKKLGLEWSRPESEILKTQKHNSKVQE